MKQSDWLAKWCQVELAKCDVSQKRKPTFGQKKKKNLSIQIGNIKLPTQKVHSLSDLGAILLLNFLGNLIAVCLYSKLEVVSKYAYITDNRSAH